MKNKLFRAFLILLSVLMLFCSCGKKSPAMEYNKANDTYTNPKTNIAYRPAPACYEATSRAGAVARLSKSKDAQMQLYAIQGVDTSRYLSGYYYELFYASDVTLPTLRELGAEKALFSKSQIRDYAFSQIDDAAVLSKLVELYEGVSIDEDLLIFEDGTVRSLDYTLKFASSDYAMMNYLVDYYSYSKELTVWEPIDSVVDFPIVYQGFEVTVEEENGQLYAVYHLGTDFLCDRVTRNFYPIGDVLKGYHEQLGSEG